MVDLSFIDQIWLFHCRNCRISTATNDFWHCQFSGDLVDFIVYKRSENGAHQEFQESKEMHLSPKPMDGQVIKTQNWEKQQITHLRSWECLAFLTDNGFLLIN